MTALIPVHMSECLAPKEVGELLTAANQDKESPEDFIVSAIREKLASRRQRQAIEGSVNAERSLPSAAGQVN